MSPASQHPDVVVIGGGLIGLAVSWRAAGAGMAVTLCDPGPDHGVPGWASWAAAGMLAPVTEVHYGEEALLQLNLEAKDRWRSFAGELAEVSGRDPGYRECGTVFVARDADDRAALDELLRFQRELGLDVELLRSRDLRALEPSLAPSVRGGLLAPADHQVDNRACIAALKAACGQAGVETRPARVAGLLASGERVTGVRLEGGGEIVAGYVVLAAGCWSGQLAGVDPRSLPPVRPVKGQLLHLRGPAPLATRNVRGLDCYIVSRPDGRVVVGATVEEQGFDVTPTAGAVGDLLRDARELLPDIAELDFVEVAVGLRPGTPDNAPLIGAAPSLDGLVLATGHYRNGVLLTPITADLVVELLDTGKLPDQAAPFAPDRFP
ncbi:MAG: glycine oxidase ThiO [Egibacteraceae bacterium]